MHWVDSTGTLARLVLHIKYGNDVNVTSSAKTCHCMNMRTLICFNAQILAQL